MTAGPSSIRAPRDFSIRDLKVQSFTGTYTFFYFHHDLSVEDGCGVFLDGAWHAITRHPTDAAFRLNPTGTSRDLLVSSSSALDSVKRAFSRGPLDRVKVGSTPRSISYPMESLPLIQSLFQVLHDRDSSLVQSLIDREFTAFAKQLVDFKPLVGVLFSDGWEVCPTFVAFAKPDRINVKEAAFHFNTPVTLFFP